MSTGSNWQDGNTSPQPPKQGMGSGMKIFLILLGVGGGLMLICCGGFAFFGYKLSQGMTVVPAEVTARTQEIAKIDIPPSYSPFMGMKLPIPGMNINMVMYSLGGNPQAGVEGDGALMLMEMSVPYDQAKTQNVDQQFRQGMSNNQGNEKFVRQLDITESEEKEVEIRGQKVKATYATGTDKSGGGVFKQVTVLFPGKVAGNSVALLVQAAEDKWNQEEVEQMIDSIE